MRLAVTRLGLIALMAFAVLGGLLVARPQARSVKDAAFVRVTPQDIKWVTDTDGSGVQRAVLEGDPAKPGLYVIRVKFPRGMMSTNHYHREDRHVVVIQGTWYSGTGEDFAPEKTLAMRPGSYMKHPAGATHFDGAKEEEVIVQIIGIGPTETVRLRPQQGNYVSTLKK
jgi:quercetin dioxygenase-like cupin family protein